MSREVTDVTPKVNMKASKKKSGFKIKEPGPPFTPGQDIFTLLKKTPVENLLEKKTKKIVTLSENATLHHVMATLAKHQILSVPICAADSTDILGLVDMLDIVMYIIATLAGVTSPEQEIKWQEIKFEPEAFKSDKIRNAKISDVINFSKKDDVVLVSPSSTLIELINLFAQGVHRVPVVTDTGSPYIANLISQSDIINFLADHMHDIENDKRFNLPVEKVGLDIHKNVISISSTGLAIHAFFLMYFNKVPAVAVIDPNTEELVANISASDIRGLTTDNLDRLLLPITEFIAGAELGKPPNWDVVADTVGSLSIRPKMVPPITCTWYTPFHVAIQKLALYRLHRVWIVDHHNKPIGVISLTDVNRKLRDWSKISTAAKQTGAQQ